MATVKSGVAGWLLGLCGVLLIWQPISFGLVASSWLDALVVRGVPLALLLALQFVVTAFGIAAGLALAARRPAAVAMAKLSLTGSAAVALFVYATPYAPNNRTPGETPIYEAATVLWYGAWLAYLYRSRRVREIFLDRAAF
jgi:hypothetical protein